MGGSLLRVSLLAVGVCVGAAVGAGGGAWLRIGIVGCSFACALALLRRLAPLTLVALALFGFASGAGAAAARSRSPTLALLARDVPACAAEGKVLESLGGLGTLVALRRLNCEGHAPLIDPGVAVVDLAAHAGSELQATGWLVALGDDPFERARRRAGATAEFAIEDVRSAPPSGIAALPAAVRDGLTRAGLEIDPPEAALIRGLTIGDTEAITAATMEEFRRSGLAHLLAVSGSNVSIVLAAMMVVGARLAFRTRLGLGAAALFLFVLIVGPDASVLRAAAMGAVGLLALASGTRSEPLHALAVAVAAVVVVRPHIVFSLGLHLSVLATAGIIVLTPALMTYLRFLPRLVAVPMAVTLGAQLAVVPLLVAAFEEASIVAPIANLLAAPAVPPATILGLAAGVVAPFHELAAALLLRVAEPFASWILFVGRVCSEPAWANVRLPSVAGWCLAIPVAALTASIVRRRWLALPSST